MDLAQFGRLLILFGVLIVVIGLILTFAPKIPFFRKLPGDIIIEGKNFKLYFPIVTFLIISLLLTIILNIFFKR